MANRGKEIADISSNRYLNESGSISIDDIPASMPHLIWNNVEFDRQHPRLAPPEDAKLDNLDNDLSDIVD